MSKLLALLFVVGCSLAPLAAQTDNSPAPRDERSIKNVNFFPGSPVNGLVNVAYSSTNAGGPEWDRPFADGTCCSGLGPVRYSAQSFYVGASGAYDVESIQDGWDGYLFIYADSFDPLAQTVNFVAGDDDGNGGIGTSNIDGVNLDANRTYIIVTTGFAAGDEGAFTNNIDGAGPITLGDFNPASIPTLGEWGLVAFVLLLAGAGIYWTRRQAA